jgi:hypothetical protein
MSETPRTDKETGKPSGNHAVVYASFARKLERELTETCKRYEIACETAAKMHAAAVGEIKGPHIDPVQDVANVRRERDEYKGLLIELYNDLNIIHSGNAVRKLSKMFREENYN